MDHAIARLSAPPAWPPDHARTAVPSNPLRHCRARAGMHLTGRVLRRPSICFASSTSRSNASVDGLKGIECLFGSSIDVLATDPQLLWGGTEPIRWHDGVPSSLPKSVHGAKGYQSTKLFLEVVT
jgi:hypothetical protein